MHVASVMLFEGPAPPYEELLDAIDRRLSLVPRYRQRLAFVPLGQGRPRWVDDPHLNLRYHVRATALPAPGTEDQLRELAGRVFSQQLDRDKPLWEIWLVEGLEGDRFALLAKTHHALVDGISGIDIVSVLFDTSPEPAAPPATGDRWLPAPLPTGAQLLGEALVERATIPGEVVRSVRRSSGRRGASRRTSRPPPSASARWPGRASTPRRRRSYNQASARTGASPGCARTSATSRRSRTSSAARSTTSCSRSSPARSASTCARRGVDTEGLAAEGDDPGQRALATSSAASSATRSRR